MKGNVVAKRDTAHCFGRCELPVELAAGGRWPCPTTIESWRIKTSNLPSSGRKEAWHEPEHARGEVRDPNRAIKLCRPEPVSPEAFN